MKYISDVVAFVLVVVFLVVAVIFTPMNESGDDWFGFVTHPTYTDYAVPISSISVDTTLIFNNVTDTASRLFEVTDDIIYRRAYISYDGQTWTQFNITPVSTSNGEWINARSLVSVSFTPAKLRLNSTRTISNNTYIIIYSCSKNTTIHNWSCHDGWQIIKFDAKLNSGVVPPMIITKTPSHPYITEVSTNTYDTINNKPPEMSIDGNLSAESRWSGEGKPGNDAWIKYTFKNNRLVTGINMLFYKSNLRISRFTLEYSLDDTSWFTLGDFSSGGTATSYETFRFNSITAKYFRIIGHGNTEAAMANWTSIVEVQFINTTTPTCTTHSYSTCNSGNVYWYNSCNVREGIKTTCTSTQTCPDTVCVNNPSGTPMKIFIIGDSTAAEYSTADWYPLTGWGMEMQQFFDDQYVTIVNNAESGASSKSYLTSSRWTDTYNSMGAGDYLFIQFSANDEHEDVEHHTTPYTTYKEYLQMYIDAAREKGVIPVLLTPVERNYWNGAELIYSHTDPFTNTDYPPAMMELAQEQDVLLIDVLEKTRALYLSLGQDVVTYDLFINIAPGDYPNYPEGRVDNSHYQVRGAYEVAKLVVEGIQELGSNTNLVQYIIGATPTPTCTDGIQNQGESGIDCGGPCKACSSGSDICSTSGYNCGTIPGTSTSCGTCPTGSGLTCSNNLCVSASGTTYYVATNGLDTNPGTKTQPWKTWQKGFNAISPGDILYIRDGTYYPTATLLRSKYCGVAVDGKKGTSDKKYHVWAYPGENPVLDGRNIAGSGGRLGIQLYYSAYWHLKGLEITRVDQLSTGNYYGGAGLEVKGGNNNLIEDCVSHHNGGYGFGARESAYETQFLNCDAYSNYDAYTNPPGEDADGFDVGYISNDAVVRLTGCRAWDNADDGFDMYQGAGFSGTYYLTNCWSWHNGYIPGTDTAAGNGCGFKYGDDYQTYDGVTRRFSYNCIAYDNRERGFSQESANVKKEFYNCISYANHAWGWSFYGLDVADVLKNNIAFGDGIEQLGSRRISDHNSWDSGAPQVSSTDFVSVDGSELALSRNADGSLPDIEFLHLRSDSDLIDKGTATGLPSVVPRYNTPDLGAFEYYP